MCNSPEKKPTTIKITGISDEIDVLDPVTREELMVEGMTAIRNMANGGDNWSSQSDEERLRAIEAVSQVLHNLRGKAPENIIMSAYLHQAREVGYGVFHRYTPKLSSTMHKLIIQSFHGKFLELDFGKPGKGKNVFIDPGEVRG